MNMETEALRQRYPGWQVWQSDRGFWWATRRHTRNLPSSVSLTVGDVSSTDELASLIEADEAELANHHSGLYGWIASGQLAESC
ncbi:MAG: hypothetical protein L0Y54_05005 [Sporichthyaceae bacterium]|nr:hypothetical protein [Sporichthyaceae bacterium]